MIGGKSILAIVTARGGSKGIPRKNIRLLGKKPLIAWTIEEAKKSKYIDRLVLSSDDSEIIKVAESYGCEVPFVRPAELAQDDTPGIDVVLHALNVLPKYDYVVLLQPTSPLRTSFDIDQCIEKCMNEGAKSCVSVTKSDKPPQWMFYISNEDDLVPVICSEKVYTRRQDIPTAYVLNGAVYVAEVEWIKKSRTFLSNETKAYVMPKVRSLDIDTEMDLMFCEAILTKLKHPSS